MRPRGVPMHYQNGTLDHLGLDLTICKWSVTTEINIYFQKYMILSQIETIAIFLKM